LIKRALRYGILLGIPCGIVAGAPIFGIGMIFGLFIGPVVGAATGVVSGTLLAVITTTFYLPFPSAKNLQYRLVAASICLPLSLMFVLGVTEALFSHPRSEPVDNHLLVFVLVPAVLAALYASQSLATWYIKHSMLG
jgi:hypothetical protein